MASIERMLQWMSDRKGRVTYSMTSRMGPGSYDCSSAVYLALQAGGFLPGGTMGNTDTLFNHLEQNGWQQIGLNSQGSYTVRRGDIFIWGTRGASTGAAGHTGIFVDGADNMIHCNYGYNGITVNNHDFIWQANGCPAITIYRYSGSTSNGTGEATGGASAGGGKINLGSLDVLEMKNGRVHAGGWHYAIGEREFIIALDADTGKEITRAAAPAVKRTDVQKIHAHLLEADKSGFNVLLTVPGGRKIKILARTTNSKDGNSDYTDLHFSKVLTVPVSGSSFSVGKKVKLLHHATHYQTGQKVPSWAKNKSYTVQQIKGVNQSNSKKAYLLKEIQSWVLEQDLS